MSIAIALDEHGGTKVTDNDPAWEILGDAQFTGGRIILTPSASAVGYLTNNIPLKEDSWTVETVFRSTGLTGQHQGALALKYVAKDDDKSVWDSFDGLKVIVDSNSNAGSSIHAFLSDGSVDLTKPTRYDEAFGSCIIPYQDSQVPNTLRISYYDGFLVVQVNNRVCVKTSRVKLPSGYKLGLMAQSGPKHEQFEVLTLKAYSGAISEVIENDLLSANQPKVVTEFVQLDDKGAQVNKIQVEKLAAGIARGRTANDDVLQSVEKMNTELLEKFSTMQSKVLAMSSGSSNDLSYLDDQNKKIEQLHNSITKLSQEMVSFQSSITGEFLKLTTSVKKLNQDNINQLRDNEHSITEISKQIQYLVLSEKQREDDPIHGMVSGLKYLLLPVLVLSLGLCWMAYRLRHDIKTKLL